MCFSILGARGNNLDDLEHMDGNFWKEGVNVCLQSVILEFQHTGDLESLNSLLLKYSSKKDSYG